MHFLLKLYLFVSLLIRLRMATVDCFVEYVVFIYIIPTFYFTKIVLAKVPENMAPKKSKVKKPKVERSVTQPAKGIIERSICSHPMLKRVQKEVCEL
ncbi:unnamed protein product [Bathycoccus prasinos]